MFSHFCILARTSLRVFRVRTGKNVRESKLLMATLGLFLLGYLVTGYLLFSWGLRYLFELPGVGGLLVERTLYMLYFFFFIMLVFSNAVLLYSGLFRGREMAWLLTLPVSPRAIFCWKAVESLTVSSWGVTILSAPLLLAFGRVFQADAWFYVKSIVLFIPYLVLPAAVGAALVIILVRLWGRIARTLFWLGIAALLWKAADSYFFARRIIDENSASASQAIRQVLGHTELAAHPLLPSSWMSELILHWVRSDASRQVFYSLLLLAQALFCGWLCVELFSRFTYPCWTLSHRRRAARVANHSGGRLRLASDGLPVLPGERGLPFWKWFGLGRVNTALVRKEAREFTRDPTQWIPSSIMFGLLFLYSLNLDRFAVDPKSRFWITLISYLNFGVCSLAVSTLSTRFIFPLFSLEGRRLWILGLAPFPLRRVFFVKLVFFCTAIALATSGLMLLSGARLLLPWETIGRFIAAICLLSFGLTALSLSLGVLFPNYQETNPSKIVSGFGGTLCLILNFGYVLLFLGVFIIPGALHMGSPERDGPAGPGWIHWASLGGGALLTALATSIPLALSLRRIRRLERVGRL
ncbi:MAG: hypothetical protein KA004_08620 [Verrucomicrobiales bacterium]|nr:hypothetical protein [Verrucomicrobiales bacterium]